LWRWADRTKRVFGPVLEPGEIHSYDIDVAPKKIPANARVMVRNGRETSPYEAPTARRFA